MNFEETIAFLASVEQAAIGNRLIDRERAEVVRLASRIKDVPDAAETN